MHIESVPNRKSPPCILLRESYREGARVRKRTLANLTHWPPHIVNGLRALLKGGAVMGPDGDAFDIVRSLPHGHVAAALGTLRKLGLDKIIASRRCRERDLAVAMVVARVIDPRSKLATARGLDPETALDKVAAAVRRKRQPLRGQDKIGVRVGKVSDRFRMSKHFHVTITDRALTYERDTAGIAEEAALDGFYVVRTSVPAETLGPEDAVRAYKDLSKAERAFHSLKTVDG